jgi:hypothetical protein
MPPNGEQVANDIVDREESLGVCHRLEAPVMFQLSADHSTITPAAVARAVLFVMVDPKDDTNRLLGQAKNNLGPSDLPSLSFKVEAARLRRPTRARSGRGS